MAPPPRSSSRAWSAACLVGAVAVLGGCTSPDAGGPAGLPSPTAAPPATSASPTGGVSSLPPAPAPPPPTRSPDASAAPSQGVQPDEQLARFVRDCEQRLDSETWQPGQVSYPRSMDLEVGRAATYNAAVDIRATPGPPGEIIDSADPTGEPVLVRCVLSARLVPVGDHLTVTPDEGNLIDGWSYQTFTPAGTVEWAWTVTATEPEPGGLRLVLRPAAVTEDLLSGRISSEQRYETDVEVTGSLITRASHWMTTEFPLLQALLVTVGTLLVGLLAWFGGLRTKWRELRRPEPAAASGPDRTAAPRTRTTKPGTRRRGSRRS